MNSWVRLWHDMPTDPKFRTIARAAKQPLPTVVAVFTFMLADASANETERGRTTATDEDIASAFDLDEAAVIAIREAMQGRVLDGNKLAGWEKRQPKKEDNSAERAKAWRASRRSENASERGRTPANATERQDIEEDTDQDEENTPPAPQGARAPDLFDEIWEAFPRNPLSVEARAEASFNRLKGKDPAKLLEAVKRFAAYFEAETARRKRPLEEALSFVPHLSTWIDTDAWREAYSLPVGKPAGPEVPMVRLDRDKDRDLWAACERLSGKKAPTSGLEWSFKAELVDRARNEISASRH